jgi:hypothetical protein
MHAYLLRGTGSEVLNQPYPVLRDPTWLGLSGGEAASVPYIYIYKTHLT